MPPRQKRRKGQSQYRYHPCTVYFPAFTIKIHEMWVNVTYMDGLGYDPTRTDENVVSQWLTNSVHAISTHMGLMIRKFGVTVDSGFQAFS